MKPLIVTALAIACGTSAVIGVSRWRDSKLNTTVAPVEKVQLVVAAANIEPNELLTLQALTLREWPKDSVPENAIFTVDDVVDQYAKTAITKGDLLSKGKISEQPVGLMAKIRPGMRAISVLTPKYSSSVAGLVMPGQYVDVLVARKGAASSVRANAETLLQHVQVLAVDRQTRPEATGKKTDTEEQKLVQSITLEVTPSQAERLSIAQMEGEILLVLRGAEDEEIVEMPKTAAPAAPNLLLSTLDKALEMMAANARQPVEEEVPEPTMAPSVQPIDIPVYTLRGNRWGYALARQPVPQAAPQPAPKPARP